MFCRVIANLVVADSWLHNDDQVVGLTSLQLFVEYFFFDLGLS